MTRTNGIYPFAIEDPDAASGARSGLPVDGGGRLAVMHPALPQDPDETMAVACWPHGRPLLAPTRRWRRRWRVVLRGA